MMRELGSSTAPAADRGGRRGLGRALAAGAAALTCIASVSVRDPNQPGHYPMCPILAATGLYCPGCGSLRAIYAMGHGDVATAWARNPFAVLAVPLLVVVWGLWVRRVATGRTQQWVPPPWLIYLTFGAIIAFAVLRNVPGWTWLSPA